MRHLTPITVDDTRYFDLRGELSRERRKEGIKTFQEQVDKRFDLVVSFSGLEPGCSTLRHSTARREFELSDQALSGDRDFAKWRKQREAQRLCIDPQTSESFRLFAWNRDGPVGGILIYNVELLKRVDGVIRYMAGCGPMTEDPVKAAEFMLHLLDNPTDGFDDQGDPVTMQLVKWTFPVLDIRNRWDVSRPRPTIWLNKFAATHDVVLENRSGQEFITSLKRLP